MKHAALNAPRRIDRLVAVGAVIFVVGVVCVAVVLVLFLTGSRDVPLALTLGASLLPVGFALALLGILSSARGR